MRLQKENRVIFEDLNKELKFNLINPDETLCNESGKCLMGTNSKTYYGDDDHLDVNGVLKLKLLLSSLM